MGLEPGLTGAFTKSFPFGNKNQNCMERNWGLLGLGCGIKGRATSCHVSGLWRDAKENMVDCQGEEVFP